MRQGTMFVSKTWEAPELIGKALHCWLNEASYSTLTHEEVWKDLIRADAANSLSEDILQAALDNKQAQ